MARVNPKDGKLLYHLTALDNVVSIFSYGLISRSKINNFVDIADSEIIEHREKYNLTSLVPFHFIPKSPFAGRVQKDHKEKEFVYITITRILAKANEFKIIPSHPLYYKDEPLEFNEGIEKINWDLLELRDYSVRECKLACMAECNTHKRILAEHFHSIIVNSERTQRQIYDWYKRVKGESAPFHVNVSPHMFLNHV